MSEFVERVVRSRDELWDLYGSETIFESRDEYDKFVDGRESVTMIRFMNLEELDTPVDFKVLNAATGIRKMPNGGMYIGRETLSQMILKGS